VGFQLGTTYLGFEQSEDTGEQGSTGFAPWFTVSDLFEVVARARLAGAKVRMEPTRKERGVIVAALVDPFGSLFGLHQKGT
jgi:predicted enzyme related to lactoylglutathione lyase